MKKLTLLLFFISSVSDFTNRLKYSLFILLKVVVVTYDVTQVIQLINDFHDDFFGCVMITR